MEPSEEERTPTPVAAEQPAVQEKSAGNVIRRILRWFLGLLIIFGLGAVTVLYTLYIPARQALRDQRSGLQQAEQRIAELEEQVASYSKLESENQDLHRELDNANLHTLLLSALANVNAARVALLEEDVGSARAYLAKVDSIKDLAGLVAPEQRDEVTDMVTRLDLAVSELEKDQFAALSDLEVLAANLTQLKNTFFSEP